MKIDGKSLPRALREQIGAATNAKNPDCFVHQTESSLGKGCAIFFGLGTLVTIVMAALANVHPFSVKSYWGGAEAMAAAIVGFLMALMALSSWIRLRACKRSTLQPAVVISPILVAHTGLDDEPLSLWYLREIAKPNFTHHHTNGAYTHTAVSFAYEDRSSLSFQIRDKKKAENLLAFMRTSGDTIRRWHEQGVLEEKASQLDWIRTHSQPAPADEDTDAAWRKRVASWEQPLTKGSGRALVALGIGFVLATACWGTNLVMREQQIWDASVHGNTPMGYQDYLQRAPLGFHKAEAEKRFDDSSYEQALSAHAAVPLREYRTKFPSGRHLAEAKDAIAKLYVDAEKSYLEKTPKADEQAALGMKALFAHMRAEDAPRVGIAFLPAEGMEGDELERATREATGSSKVHPVGPSFSPEANERREDRIVAIMTESWKKVIPEELFELRKVSADEPGPRFLVRFGVVGTGKMYEWRSEESLPSKDRQFWIGIAVTFDFSLQVPGSEHPPDRDPKKGFKFSTAAEPPPNFDSRGTSPGEVYDRMAEVAFDQFQVKLANAYGLELTMPENWGQIPGMRHDPDPLGGTRVPEDDALAGIRLTPLCEAVFADPKTRDLPEAQQVRLVAARARKQGIKATPDQIRSQLAIARALNTMKGDKGDKGEGDGDKDDGK